MEGLISGVVGASVFLAVNERMTISDVGLQWLLAIGIVTINIVLQPLLKLLFNKIKEKLKSKQKTPQNDGELADILLDVVDKAEDKVEKVLNLSSKGGDNGKNGNDEQH